MYMLYIELYSEQIMFMLYRTLSYSYFGLFLLFTL
jgi:hypothetical protein